MLRQKDGFHGERSLMMLKMIRDMVEQDPLVSMLHITDIGYYPHARHHYRERREPIDQYVYIYCVDGAGWYQIGDKRYDVVRNQYFILPAGVPHAYCADGNNPWTIYWIHFKGELASYYAKDITGPVDVKPGLHSRIRNRIDLFEEIFNTLSTGFGNENLRYVSSLFHYYLGSLRYISQYRAGGGKQDDDNVASATIHYMKENLEKHLSLKDLSDYTGYSASYISMMFKQSTGHSPLAYLNLLKIQQACQLLDTTTMKVNQICYKIGIDDAYYFSRLFSKTMGMSPKEYREMKKG